MKTDDKIQQILTANPALQMIAQLDGGRVVLALSEKYMRVVESVKRTGQKGELNLKLVIKPDGKGQVETVEVHGDVKLKMPERGHKPTTFFVTEDNTLSRTDPGQREIEFPEPATPAIGQGQAKAAGAH